MARKQEQEKNCQECEWRRKNGRAGEGQEEHILVNSHKSWQICESVLMIRLCVTTAEWFLMPQHFTHTSFRERARAHFNHCDGFHTGSFVFHINKVAQRKQHYLSIYLLVCMYVCMHVQCCMHLSLSLSIYPLMRCLSVRLVVYPSIHPSSHPEYSWYWLQNCITKCKSYSFASFTIHT